MGRLLPLALTGFQFCELANAIVWNVPSIMRKVPLSEALNSKLLWACWLIFLPPQCLTRKTCSNSGTKNSSLKIAVWIMTGQQLKHVSLYISRTWLFCIIITHNIFTISSLNFFLKFKRLKLQSHYFFKDFITSTKTKTTGPITMKLGGRTSMGQQITH